MKLLTIVLLFAFIPVGVQSRERTHPFQSYPMSDEMIANAIEEGEALRGHMTGLSLKDSLSRFARHTGNPNLSTGFSVDIYTPYSWVSQQASWAAARYKKLAVADVGDSMTDAVLRVYANPDVPTRVTEQGLIGTSGVDHVIIRSTAKKDFAILQPVIIEEDVEYAYNAFGAGIAFASKMAVFELQQVVDICKLDNRREFFVVVIGTTGEEKKFKVKTKHFERLP